ncbi:MAG: carboxypeptidase-like regulatory domain-containing protein [Gemmatimonadota bacterium]|nr:carboxypeptidase-like regulatory domain-containing protein [Gemmatimonadota bacterium]
MIRVLAIPLAVILGSVLPAGSAAQEPETAMLRVRVLDSYDGTPVVGARVGLVNVDLYALTDVARVASLSGIPPGTYDFEVAMFGYAPEVATLSLGPGAFATGDIRLAVQPFALEEIMVEGRARWSAQLQLGGFYERAELGLGVQLDRLAIRQFNAIELSEVLERIPTRPGFGGFINPVPTPEDVDFAEELPEECAPGIFVDGSPWSGYIDDIPLSWVEGMEFYTSPSQVPIQYLGDGAFCGLLLVWTG